MMEQLTTCPFEDVEAVECRLAGSVVSIEISLVGPAA